MFINELVVVTRVDPVSQYQNVGQCEVIVHYYCSLDMTNLIIFSEVNSSSDYF